MADRIPNTGVNLPASGTFTPPPAANPIAVTQRSDGSLVVTGTAAPQEVTVAGSERPTADQIAQARSNERDLPTYAPRPMTDEQMASYLGKTVEEIQALKGAAHVPTSGNRYAPNAPLRSLDEQIKDAAAVGQLVTSAPVLQPAPLPSAAPEPSALIPGVLVDPSGRPIISSIKGVDAPLPSQDPAGLRAAARAVHPAASTRPDPNEPYYPAASNTDSPSRGIPTASLDKGKQITGGFGDLGEAQYFPLDGRELKAVIEGLLDAQRQRVQDDLRFSIAATYPRVRVRCLIEVECFAADHSFQIEKIMVPPHEKTPLDVAKRYGDRVVFCIVEQHLEMTDAGESVTPPNAARMEHGLPLPRKHVVELPGRQRMLVDV